MSDDKLVKREETSPALKNAETVGLVKGGAIGAIGAVVIMKIGLLPILIIGGGVAAWKFASNLKKKG